MAFDPTLVVVAAIGAIPGIAALINSRNAKKEGDARVDSAAFQAAKDFYSGTLDEYKEELTQTRRALKETRAELEKAKTEREFLSMRVTMLERDKDSLETSLRLLESRLQAYEVSPPPQDDTPQ